MQQLSSLDATQHLSTLLPACPAGVHRAAGVTASQAPWGGPATSPLVILCVGAGNANILAGKDETVEAQRAYGSTPAVRPQTLRKTALPNGGIPSVSKQKLFSQFGGWRKVYLNAASKSISHGRFRQLYFLKKDFYSAESTVERLE